MRAVHDPDLGVFFTVFFAGRVRGVLFVLLALTRATLAVRAGFFAVLTARFPGLPVTAGA